MAEKIKEKLLPLMPFCQYLSLHFLSKYESLGQIHKIIKFELQMVKTGDSGKKAVDNVDKSVYKCFSP